MLCQPSVASGGDVGGCFQYWKEGKLMRGWLVYSGICRAVGHPRYAVPSGLPVKWTN
jgi:hypothetical protein